MNETIYIWDLQGINIAVRCLSKAWKCVKISPKISNPLNWIEQQFHYAVVSKYRRTIDSQAICHLKSEILAYCRTIIYTIVREVIWIIFIVCRFVIPVNDVKRSISSHCCRWFEFEYLIEFTESKSSSNQIRTTGKYRKSHRNLS